MFEQQWRFGGDRLSNAVRPMPTDRAITRSLVPQAYLRRRTSRIFRIGNLSAGIGPPPCEPQKGATLPGQTADDDPASPHQQGGHLRSGWLPSIRTGGRLPSESVAAFPWNRWPPCLGFRTRTARDARCGRTSRRKNPDVRWPHRQSPKCRSEGRPSACKNEAVQALASTALRLLRRPAS